MASSRASFEAIGNDKIQSIKIYKCQKDKKGKNKMEKVKIKDIKKEYIKRTLVYRGFQGHYFDADACRFFGSRFADGYRSKSGDIYFAESTKPPYGGLQYRVNRLACTGEVFHSSNWSSFQTATAWAKAVADGSEDFDQGLEGK